MKYSYVPKGVCPRALEFDLDGNVVTNIKFTGGCDGNLKAVSILADGMTASEIKEKLAGNTCGFKDTSCADQLTIAIDKALRGEI